MANASPLCTVPDDVFRDGTKPGSLSAIIQNYKSVTTRTINRLRRLAGRTVWQRNYHERIVRNQRELEAKRSYIDNNPMQWALDAENPDHKSEQGLAAGRSQKQMLRAYCIVSASATASSSVMR